MNAQEILSQARDREDAREAARRPIDYGRMKKVWPKQKGALTRALKIEDEDKRRARVLELCAEVVKEWDEIGCWPDDWSRFQRGLDDCFPVFYAPMLEDLR